MDTLHIVSLNCNNLGNKNKRKKLFRHLTRRNVDVVLLQETHTTPKLSKEYEAEWKRLRKNPVNDINKCLAIWLPQKHVFTERRCFNVFKRQFHD